MSFSSFDDVNATQQQDVSVGDLPSRLPYSTFTTFTETLESHETASVVSG
jgi:hypothetical protein